MEVYPAIDLMDSEVVRLYKGKASETTSYAHLGSPVEIALLWEGKGAEMLHVIDLDATLGRGNNRAVLREIVREVSIPVQYGGGLRGLEAISDVLSLGVTRVIVGTLAVREPSRVLRIGQEHGLDRVVVSLDYKDERIVSEGWLRSTDRRPSELLSLFRSEGINHFLMTSVERDGGMEGPDVGLTEVCGPDLSDIIVAGGVGSLEDIVQLVPKGFGGVVLGRALYEEKFSLPAAVQAARGYVL